MRALFGQLGLRSVLLLGDFNIDRYVIGEVSRISPEAPVPILRVDRTYDRPGGAGNAALGLKALGLSVRIMGRGEFCLEGVDFAGQVVQEGYSTPIKSRMVAESSMQQIVRVDEERIVALDPRVEAELIERLPKLLEGIDLIAVSDYGKGMVTPTLLQALIASGLPVLIDPKGRDFSRYAGAYLVKPNQREVYIAAGVEPATHSLEEAAHLVMEESGLERLLVTRASQGASLFFASGERRDFAVEMRDVRDVTGAGDTVLAMLSCALANAVALEDAVHLSMVAAGIAVEHTGCVAVTLQQLASRLFEPQKICRKEEVWALAKLLEGQEYTVLVLSKRLSSKALSLIREGGQLVLYLDEESELLMLLASIAHVRFIVVGRENLERLVSLVSPARILSCPEKIGDGDTLLFDALRAQQAEAKGERVVESGARQ